MNNDDIIRMAEEAGGNPKYPDVWIMDHDDLKRFAELARADEQKKWQDQTAVEIHEAVLYEREECAKLCDSSIHDTYIVGETGAKHYARRECAAAIRARGNK